MSIPKYKYLITYRLAEIIFDLVDAFVLRYLSNLGPLSYLSLKEQMLKCARSIKQNIIEGVSEVASLKSQIKLLGVAYGSVEELIADLEDFLRRKNLLLYPKNHPKIAKYRRLGVHLSHLSNLSNLGHLKEKPTLPTSAEEAANLLLTLCHQLSYLLKHQIESTEDKFIEEGGYTENLFLKRLNKRKSSKLPKSPKKPKLGFTLMELLILITLIAVISAIALILFNPKKQIDKALDGKRVKELNTLQKVFEDFYNDKNCYPKPEEVCYDSFTSLADDSYYCHICGKEVTPPSLSSYLAILPCDPQHPDKKYLYQVNDLNCPTWYRIYTVLSNKQNPLIEEVGCQDNCGPINDKSYQYGVTSPNTSLQRNIIDQYACYPTGCTYCCRGTNCSTPCSDRPEDFCGGEIKIFNKLEDCQKNSPFDNCPCD